MTHRKSAIAFTQGQILNPYILHYIRPFAFSYILYPPGNSVSVTERLTNDRLSLDPVGLTLLCQLKLSKWLRWIPLLRWELCFHFCRNRGVFRPTHLPFWSQPVRSHLAVSAMTQFNQYLSLCSSFHFFPLAPKLA